MVHPASVSLPSGQQPLAACCTLRRTAGISLAVVMLALFPLFYGALCAPRQLHQLPLIRQPVDIAAMARAASHDITTMPATGSPQRADRGHADRSMIRISRIMPDDYPQPATGNLPASQFR